MAELAAVLGLFLLVTGVVVALGRRTTARWERERARQAARVRRRRARVLRQGGSRVRSLRTHLPQRTPRPQRGPRLRRARSAADGHGGPPAEGSAALGEEPLDLR
jgi:Flp pilus assembly protein TadB